MGYITMPVPAGWSRIVSGGATLAEISKTDRQALTATSSRNGGKEASIN